MTSQSVRYVELLLVTFCLILHYCSIFVDCSPDNKVDAPAKNRFFQFQTEDQHRQENWTSPSNGKNDDAFHSKGFFGWTDKNGDSIDIEYISDDHGYRVIKKQRKINILSRPVRTKHELDEFEFDEDDDGDSYKFAYNTGTSFREEAKRGGVIFGKYGFITANGKLHVTHYTASKKRGFIPVRRVLDASEYKSAVDEPISPVPLRRLRSIARPAKLIPDKQASNSSNTATRTATKPNPTVTKPTRTIAKNITTTTAKSAVTTTVKTTAKPAAVTAASSSRATKSSATTSQVLHVAEKNAINHVTKSVAKTSINRVVNSATDSSTAATKAEPTPAKAETSGTEATTAKAEENIPSRSVSRSPHNVKNDLQRQFSYNLERHFHRQDEEPKGGVSGKYGWKDAQGILHEIHYFADEGGYKVRRFRNGTRTRV